MKKFKINENLSKEEVDKLFNENSNLIFKVIHNIPITSTAFDNDDLYQEGSIGLLKAIHNFDSEKGFKFSTYAYRCIHNEILLFIRDHNKKTDKLKTSLDLDIPGGKDNSHTTIGDILIDESANVEDNLLEKEMHLNLSHNLVREAGNILMNNKKYSKRIYSLLYNLNEMIINGEYVNNRDVYNKYFSEVSYTQFNRYKYRLGRVIIKSLININEEEIAEKYNRVASVKWKNNWE